MQSFRFKIQKEMFDAFDQEILPDGLYTIQELRDMVHTIETTNIVTTVLLESKMNKVIASLFEINRLFPNVEGVEFVVANNPIVNRIKHTINLLTTTNCTSTHTKPMYENVEDIVFVGTNDRNHNDLKCPFSTSWFVNPFKRLVF